MKKKSILNESNPTLEKIFSTVVAAEILGKQTGVTLRGSDNEISVVREAISASKSFDEELSNPSADVTSIMKKLGEKHIAAENFERVTGVAWPL